MLLDKDRNILKLNNYRHKQDTPFVIYTDFESILEKKNDVVKPNKQRASGYSFIVVRCDSESTSQDVQRQRRIKRFYTVSGERASRHQLRLC